jgi:hypothetical protein
MGDATVANLFLKVLSPVASSFIGLDPVILLDGGGGVAGWVPPAFYWDA